MSPKVFQTSDGRIVVKGAKSIEAAHAYAVAWLAEQSSISFSEITFECLDAEQGAYIGKFLPAPQPLVVPMVRRDPEETGRRMEALDVAVKLRGMLVYLATDEDRRAVLEIAIGKVCVRCGRLRELERKLGNTVDCE